MMLKVRWPLLIAGILLISAGVGMVCVPAGIITFGIFVAALAFLNPAPKEKINGETNNTN
jgi:hypothetical protein